MIKVLIGGDICPINRNLQLFEDGDASGIFNDLLEEFKDGLFISRARHKAFIEVNEKGTEAAAATVVVITWESAAPEITLNKPFVYLIRENHTGTILFMGRMDNPSL